LRKNDAQRQDKEIDVLVDIGRGGEGQMQRARRPLNDRAFQSQRLCLLVFFRTQGLVFGVILVRGRLRGCGGIRRRGDLPSHPPRRQCDRCRKNC